MENKTCGKCKYYDWHGGCNKIPDVLWLHSTNIACIKFDPKNPTNGDKIQQMSDEELSDRLCKHAKCEFCPAKSSVCGRGNGNIKDCRAAWLNWINAPAESEAEDE